MDKKLLLGLIAGLGAYYLLMIRGNKKCSCKDELALSTDNSDPKTACEKQVEEGMKNIRFANAEAMAKYRSQAIKDCKNRANEKKHVKTEE